MAFAKGHHRVLDGTLLNVVADLVAGHLVGAGDGGDALQSVLVEVADAPGANLPAGHELLESSHRVFEREVAFPMEQIAIEPLGTQTPQRPLAGGRFPI